MKLLKSTIAILALVAVVLCSCNRVKCPSDTFSKEEVEKQQIKVQSL